MNKLNEFQEGKEQHSTMNDSTSGSLYNKELEKLIDMALIDGVLTEQKKRVLLKKAESFGIDLDEFEMVLDAKVYERRQKNNVVMEQPVLKPSIEEKQPSVLNPDIENKQPSIQTLLDLLNEAEDTSIKELEAKIEQRRRELNKLSAKDIANLAGDIIAGGIPGVGLVKGLLSDDDDDESEIDKEIAKLTTYATEKLIAKKRHIISSFPTPTSKDGIAEFLSTAIPYTKAQINLLSNTSKDHNQLAPIWKMKCEQIIKLASNSLKNDASAMDMINEYTKQIEGTTFDKISGAVSNISGAVSKISRFFR
jgi:hypothetical protein